MRVVLAAVLIMAMSGGPASADVGAVTGLPVPRFVSLAAEVANLRLGPRRSYDVVAVYRKRGLPLKIVGEFDNWREVVDFEGDRGWMHTSLLSGRRTVMVVGEPAVMRRGPGAEAPAMAEVAPRVVAELLRCERGAAWCFVELEGRRGWLERSRLWGIAPAAPTS
jgi:SH3-like domain-containing protein